MSRRDWFIVIIPLFVTWGLDQITKLWATHLMGPRFFGPLGFVLHHNQGAMLGTFADLPAVLRVVSLSTGGAFLLFAFIIIQYLLPIRSLRLRAGLSILIGGILGNVTDRIVYGYVVDFITFGSMQFSSPVFNIADALQWVGYALIAFALFRESSVLWPASDSRHTRWVNFRFQIKFCLILMAVGFGLSVIAGVYSYTFLRVTVIDLIGRNPRVMEHYLTPFLITFILICFAFAGILFLAGRIISQRIAGPLYAFEKYLDDLMNDRPRPLRLRSKDEFKNLEILAERLNNEWRKRTEALLASQAGLTATAVETLDPNQRDSTS